MITLLAGAFALYAQADSAEMASSRKLRVLTTLVPLYCFAVNVAGDAALVTNLLPAGVGPHDYQFSRKDVEKIGSADLIVVNGLGLEDWLEKALASAGKQSKKIVVASAGIPESLLFSPKEGREPRLGLKKTNVGPNPHLWLDPELVTHMVTNIVRAMQTADPARAMIYSTNAALYVERLHSLNRELGLRLAPLAGKPVLTYHDSFPYFIRRYGLRSAGVVETVPDVEPSPRQLSALLQGARHSGVRALFTEPQFTSRLVDRISRDLGIPQAALDPMETGALTPQIYEETMRQNANTLVRLLQ